MKAIDLNCDLGEGAAHDAGLMPLITSANIACGGHAGDADTMRRTVLLAKQVGVAVGAHPGFADRANFGRKELALPPAEVAMLVKTQVGALRQIAADCGVALAHVKPHGALYNMAARDAAMAEAVAQAVREVDPRLILVGLADSQLVRAGDRAGLRVAHEVFADRAYRRDGSLVARGEPGALIDDAATAASQVLRLVREGRVRSIEGVEVPLSADTVCLHGDEAQAVAFAKALRQVLEREGIAIRPLITG